MADRRHKNTDWLLQPCDENGNVSSGTVTNAVLMDIRDELRRLNSVFACWRFQGIPDQLGRIDKRLQGRFGPIRPRKKGKPR